jgi:antagonist of KipI
MQANGLVGNAPDVAGLEFALVGPTLEAQVDIGAVVFGAPFPVQVNRQPIANGTTFNVPTGSVLKIGAAAAGLRGYLAIRGGIHSKLILGSRSSFEPLQRGDVLPCESGRVARRSLAEPLVSYSTDPVPPPIRCMPGAQADWFTLPEFFGPEFLVTPASNRMGIRLQGKPLTRPQREMVSEPVCPGSVQVVNDGQCIVLGVDGQTIGGYPKVAQVITADLDRLGQLRPGQRVVFEMIGLDRAEFLRQERERRLAILLTRLAAGHV